MRREQVCGFVEPTGWPMTGRREEQRERARKGLRRGKDGILCNGVENTKERRTHVFVIFVSLHPLPPPHLFLLCLWFPVSLFVADLNPLCLTFRVSVVNSFLTLTHTHRISVHLYYHFMPAIKLCSVIMIIFLLLQQWWSQELSFDPQTTFYSLHSNFIFWVQRYGYIFLKVNFIMFN